MKNIKHIKEPYIAFTWHFFITLNMATVVYSSQLVKLVKQCKRGASSQRVHIDVFVTWLYPTPHPRPPRLKMQSWRSFRINHTACVRFATLSHYCDILLIFIVSLPNVPPKHKSVSGIVILTTSLGKTTHCVHKQIRLSSKLPNVFCLVMPNAYRVKMHHKCSYTFSSITLLYSFLLSPDWNIKTTIARIAIKCGANIDGPSCMNHILVIPWFFIWPHQHVIFPLFQHASSTRLMYWLFFLLINRSLYERESQKMVTIPRVQGLIRLVLSDQRYPVYYQKSGGKTGARTSGFLAFLLIKIT